MKFGTASLRLIDRDTVTDVALGREVEPDRIDLAVACSLCGCPMSGSALVANRTADWCQNRACWCHDEQDVA